MLYHYYKKLKTFSKILSSINFKTYYGFIQGHSYLTEQNIYELRRLVENEDQEIISHYEKRFSEILGYGDCVSFGSARMAFFTLMKILNISTNDEIILLGSTCSVMVNAILRVGAKPIFSDIDENTFGSSAIEIRKVLSSKTKMIVAQHTFGIPCEIEEIQKLAVEKNIFLLEDCALTLGSKINNKVCGTFGDASIYSTDNTKPINTLTGGIIYSENKKLISLIKNFRSKCKNISNRKTYALYKQFLLEKKFCKPNNFGKYEIASSINKNFGKYGDPFFSDDFGTAPSNNYPYPTHIPTFLSMLGIFEINRWKKESNKRKNLCKKIISIISEKYYKNSQENFKIYFDKNREIIPLRLVWSPENYNQLYYDFKTFVQIESTWFKEPLVAFTEPIENYNYTMGMCKKSEKIGKNLINLPCNISDDGVKDFISYINSI